MSRARLGVVLLGVLALCGLARAQQPGGAASSEGTLERAHEVFMQADADYRLGKFTEAAAGYERAYDVAHAPAILYDIAQAHRRIYETTNALPSLRRAYSAYRAFLRDAPEAPQHGNAEREVTRLRAKLVAFETGAAALLLAEKLLAEGDAADAVRLVERRLAEPDLSRADLVATLEAGGRASARAGDRATAVDRFERALTVDPLIALGADGGGAAAEAWSTAQARLRAHGPLALADSSRAASYLTVRVRDPLHMVARVALHARVAGQAEATEERAAERGGDTRLDVPAAVVAAASPGVRIQCWVVALGDARAQLASLGGSSAPLELTARSAPPRRRTWLWATIGAGAVVVGAAVGLGVYFGTRPSAPGFSVPTQ